MTHDLAQQAGMMQTNTEQRVGMSRLIYTASEVTLGGRAVTPLNVLYKAASASGQGTLNE